MASETAYLAPDGYVDDLVHELGDSVRDFRITRDARGWERPSDHVPVTAVLDV